MHYQDKLCGLVTLFVPHGNAEDEEKALRTLLYPLVPILASNLLGSMLAARGAVDAHEFFLATMSHEIRTPLCGIIGMSRLLQEQSNLTAAQNEHVDIIHRCGFHLLEIINDILDYAKMMSSPASVVLDNVSFSIRETVEEAFEVVCLKAHEKHLLLLPNVDSNVPEFIMGDRKRLRQILINLLSNGIKFTDRGNVQCHVKIDTTGSSSSSATAVADPWLTVDVEDTGIGIAPEDFPHVFQSFVQLKSNVLEASDGTGLGLAICKQLTALMKGEIGIKYSKVNQGTCMSLRVPLRCAESLDEKSWERLSLVTEGRMAMIVDSHAQRRYQLSELLLRLKMRFMTAVSVEEALLFMRNANACGIDVVFAEGQLMNSANLQHLLNGVATVRLGETGAGCVDHVTEGAVGNALLQIMPSATRITPPTTTTTTTTEEKQIRELSILVVEDNEYNMKVAVQTLERLNCRNVQTATNGLAAVQKCTHPSAPLFDVIFMDLKMPIMDGFQATRQILSHYTVKLKRSPPPYVIAMTAFVLGTERTECKQAGMKGFLPKPIVLQELETMLTVIVKRLRGTK